MGFRVWGLFFLGGRGGRGKVAVGNFRFIAGLKKGHDT